MIRAVVLLVLAFACSACGSRAASSVVEAAPAPVERGVVIIPNDSPKLRQIRCQPVVTMNLPTDEIVAPGKIEANPNRVSKIVLPVAGRIASVLVRTGDTVTKGQPIVAIEGPDADAAVSAHLSAQASVTQAQAARGKAQADFERVRDLFEHSAIAQKEALAAEAALTQADAALEQARAADAVAARRLALLGLSADGLQRQVVVRSPLSGKVLDLAAVAGEFRNDLSAPIVTIADLSTVWVTSQVPESYIRFIQIGERVEINLVAYPGETFEGRVSRIADTLDPQTRSIKVQAEVDNRGGRFRPEMFGSIHHTKSTAPTPVVPARAIVQSEGQAVVFVAAAPGRFERREVVLGRPAGDVVRVTRGLKAGDVIAVDGAMLLNGLVDRT